jgi:cobalamin-dependent methionine synthase I
MIAAGDNGYDVISLYSDFIVAAIIKAMMASTATIPSNSGAMVTFSKVVRSLKSVLKSAKRRGGESCFKKRLFTKGGFRDPLHITPLFL